MGSPFSTRCSTPMEVKLTYWSRRVYFPSRRVWRSQDLLAGAMCGGARRRRTGRCGRGLWRGGIGLWTIIKGNTGEKLDTHLSVLHRQGNRKSLLTTNSNEAPVRLYWIIMPRAAKRRDILVCPHPYVGSCVPTLYTRYLTTEQLDMDQLCTTYTGYKALRLLNWWGRSSKLKFKRSCEMNCY